MKVVVGTLDADSGDVGSTNPFPVSVSAGLIGISNITTGTISVSGTPAVTGLLSVAAITTGTITVSNTVAVSGGGPLVGGTAIAFYWTTVSMTTVLKAVTMTICMNYTVAASTCFPVPAGKVLRLLAIHLSSQNATSATAVGAQVQMYVIASSSWSSTVGPVFAYLNAVPWTNLAGVFGTADMNFGGGLNFSAGVSMQVALKCTGETLGLGSFCVIGMLIP